MANISPKIPESIPMDPKDTKWKSAIPFSTAWRQKRNLKKSSQITESPSSVQIVHLGEGKHEIKEVHPLTLSDFSTLEENPDETRISSPVPTNSEIDEKKMQPATITTVPETVTPKLIIQRSEPPRFQPTQLTQPAPRLGIPPAPNVTTQILPKPVAASATASEKLDKLLAQVPLSQPSRFRRPFKRTGSAAARDHFESGAGTASSYPKNTAVNGKRVLAQYAHHDGKGAVGNPGVRGPDMPYPCNTFIDGKRVLASRP